MADILVVFNIAMDDLDKMTLVELAEWRERAKVRNGASE